jgi:7,8-dihydropterin-6-yl-methyl-4-(beta-D-ribofuranosyl)aminobenzene 5'-phosphate synthase
MPNNLVGPLIVTLALACGPLVSASQGSGSPPALRITVLFNNVPYLPGLAPGWGFSCVVEGIEKTLLFDTGASGEVLVANMERLGLEPGAVQVIVLSHIHGDHTGGLDGVLARNPDVEVYLPRGFPQGFQQSLADRGARVRSVRRSGRLFGNVHSTGEMDGGLGEQALVLDTPKGLVVITGCAHPGIVRLAEAAGQLMGKRIHLLMGGFHLLRTDWKEIQGIIARLKSLGVEKVAPSHCTGEEAIALFREAWGENFVEGGLGAVIEVPLP